MRNEVLSELLTKDWQNKIYEKTYPNVYLAQLANCVFVQKNSDDRIFIEQLSEFMKNNDEKIKSISVNVDQFENGEDSLDDVLIHSNYALNAFYNG